MEVSIWKVFMNSLLLEGGRGGEKERVVCCRSPVGTKNALRTLPCCSRDPVHCISNFTVSPPAEPWAALALSLPPLQICVSSEQSQFESGVAWHVGALFDWFMPFLNLFSNLGNVLGVDETGPFPERIKKKKGKKGTAQGNL